MPNLENLKKRARTLVKQHRTGHFPVATRLRRGLPRFGELSDKAILAAPFALTDALEVVAREEGFASWMNVAKKAREAKAAASSSPSPATADSPAPRLLGAFPQALVADVTRAAEFYRDTLGFRVVYLYGEPPFYGLVERGEARINLRQVHAPEGHRPRDEPDVLTANIPVRGIKTLFLELRARGVDMAQTLKEQSWGASDFIVRDPDGNLLCFASDVDQSQ